jgi:putative transposase
MPYKPVPRLQSFSYTGLHRYSLTICAHKRTRVFVNRDAVDLVVLQLTQTADRSAFAVIAYCFMPDHLHLLVEALSDKADLGEFVRVFKQRSAFHWKAAFGDQLWQRSYFEHVLRDNESPVKAARYLLANPLRAGMVTAVEDHPFLGSMTMSVRDLLYSVSDDH